MTREKRATRRGEAGFSLLELIIASLILVILATAIIEAGLRSRNQIDYEEVRRRAITIGQERFETMRAQFDYDSIATRNIDTVIVDNMGGNGPPTTFALTSRMHRGHLDIVADSLEDYVKFVSATVSWEAQGLDGATATRQVVLNTFFFRGL